MIAKAKKKGLARGSGLGKKAKTATASGFAALPGRHKAAIVLVAVILVLIWKRLIY